MVCPPATRLRPACYNAATDLAGTAGRISPPPASPLHRRGMLFRTTRGLPPADHVGDITKMILRTALTGFAESPRTPLPSGITRNLPARMTRSIHKGCRPFTAQGTS